MTKAGGERAQREAGERGRYRIFGSIGSGGMGSVHIGRLLSSADFARTVAVKRPLPELLRDGEVRAHIRREARVASRVHHPNVVATLDVVEDGDELWVIMEYVHGPSLAALLALARDRGEPVPLEIGVALVADALRGLEAVHAARDERGEPLGIVHRDVSPHNILCGMDGTARVADFGLARAEALTFVSRSVRFKGKLAYASPEQADLKPVTHASDLYSMGVVLWEVLTGRRLFQGTAPTEILAQVLAASVPAPSSVRASVPSVLDPIVARAVARDPAQRFASALDMQSALKSAVSIAPVEAVAEWLREFAGDVMAERDELLRQAERQTAESRASEADATTSPTRVPGTESTWPQTKSVSARPAIEPPRDMGGALPSIMSKAAKSRFALSLVSIAVGASLALFAADAFFSQTRTGASVGAPRAQELEQGMNTSSAASRAAPAPAPRAVPPPAPPGNPASTSAAGAPAAPPTAPSVPLEAARAKPAQRLETRPRGATQAPASCDPPYSVDADGIRHMRPGCQ